MTSCRELILFSAIIYPRVQRFFISGELLLLPGTTLNVPPDMFFLSAL
jgi:hypothetical protein